VGRPFLPGSPGHLLYNVLLGAGLVVGAPAWIPWVLLSRKRRANLPDRIGLRGVPRRTSPTGGVRYDDADHPVFPSLVYYHRECGVSLEYRVYQPGWIDEMDDWQGRV